MGARRSVSNQFVTWNPSPRVSQYQKQASPDVIARAANAFSSEGKVTQPHVEGARALLLSACKTGGDSIYVEMKFRAVVENPNLAGSPFVLRDEIDFEEHDLMCSDSSFCTETIRQAGNAESFGGDAISRLVVGYIVQQKSPISRAPSEKTSSKRITIR